MKSHSKYLRRSVPVTLRLTLQEKPQFCHKMTVTFSCTIRDAQTQHILRNSTKETSTGLVMASTRQEAEQKIRQAIESQNSITLHRAIQKVETQLADENTHGFFVDFFLP